MQSYSRLLGNKIVSLLDRMHGERSDGLEMWAGFVPFDGSGCTLELPSWAAYYATFSRSHWPPPAVVCPSYNLVGGSEA